MLLVRINGNDDLKLVVAGVTKGNVERLQGGEPILKDLKVLGIEGVHLCIAYAETNEDLVTDLHEHGIISDDDRAKLSGEADRLDRGSGL